jgi:hypothetical protein
MSSTLYNTSHSLQTVEMLLPRLFPLEKYDL